MVNFGARFFIIIILLYQIAIGNIPTPLSPLLLVAKGEKKKSSDNIVLKQEFELE